MKIFECKCGSKEIFIEESGNNKGLYCADCGKWIQWLGKNDLRLAQRQIEQSITELKEHDAKVRAEAIDEFVDALKQRAEYFSVGVKSVEHSLILEFENIAEQLKEQKE